jgi:hypothetical protein
VSDSILTNTKKLLGLDESYTVFDTDVLMHINTAFSTLNQLGVGPVEGFLVEDADTTWAQFLLNDPRLNNVKSYVFVRVKLLFDPPQTSYLLTALDKQREELEWRLNVQREDSLIEAAAMADGGSPLSEDDIIYDGGGV